MRDLFLFIPIIIFAFLALKKPQIGILTWLWLSVMNPHRLTYGFMYDWPILDFLATMTLIGCISNWKYRSSVEFHPVLKLLMCFYLWCCLTTLFSVDVSISIGDWINYTKTMLLVLLMLLFMNKKYWIIALISVFLISVGYTGIKGGVFTIITGGAHRIWGPPGTAWGDNNGVSLTMLISMPLAVGFASVFIYKKYRLSCYLVAMSFFVTLLGTFSRGGLIGFTAMAGSAILRTEKKLLSLILLLVIATGGYFFMPQSWHERMGTIANYQQEGSANTRLIQWQYAIDISKERPLFGNGFDAFFYKPYYYQYVAHLDSNRAVHSNYFQVLGEQGYIGLAMYLTLLMMLIIASRRYSLIARKYNDMKWASGLLGMLQFSVIGYAANGLTVNMAYLDLYYYILVFIVLLISQVNMRTVNIN